MLTVLILPNLQVGAVRAAVAAAVTLCQRNTQRLDPHESTMLWFRLLDKYDLIFLHMLCYGSEAVRILSSMLEVIRFMLWLLFEFECFVFFNYVFLIVLQHCGTIQRCIRCWCSSGEF